MARRVDPEKYLFFQNKFCKFLHAHQPALLLSTVCFVKAFRHNKLKSLRLHFFRLIYAYRCLQRQQVFIVDTISFRQYLPPPIFTRRFNTEHCQQCFIVAWIMILLRTGKDKIRFGVVLCNRSTGIANPTFLKQHFKMIFQSQTRSISNLS